MNLRFVEAFHWAASLGGVTRAANKLHITQPALSSRIAALEEEMGSNAGRPVALRIGASESVVHT